MIFLEFVRNNWRIILLISIIFAVVTHIEMLKSQRDSALQTITEMQQEALKQSARVELLKQQGKRDTDELQAQHVQDIQHIGSLYGKVINDDKKSIANYRIQLANKLREQSESSDSRVSINDADRPAENNGDTSIVGEESAQFYREAYIGQREYVKTLEEAGSVCATDYNTCKSYVDSEQKRIGVYSN